MRQSFFSERRIILICSRNFRLQITTKYSQIWHLRGTHVSCFSTSQFQTCMEIYMDDRIDKHSANKLRTCDQRAPTNIPIGKIEHLLSCVFVLPSVIGEEEKLISIFRTQNQLKLT
jgi:hypothetical protein